MFNDLDGSMDSREDDFEKKAEDPGFTGFHRLEKGLFADHSTAGLAPLADKLTADTAELQKRLSGLTITPKSMVGGAAELIEEVASKKISGEEDRYSRTDLVDFQANVDGAQKIVALLDPLMQKHDPALVTRVKANFGKVDAVLGKYKTAKGFEILRQARARGPQQAEGPGDGTGRGPVDLARQARHRLRQSMTDRTSKPGRCPFGAASLTPRATRRPAPVAAACSAGWALRVRRVSPRRQPWRRVRRTSAAPVPRPTAPRTVRPSMVRISPAS